jgi:hypothetical protein
MKTKSKTKLPPTPTTPLNEEELAKLRGMIQSTFRVIAPDLLQDRRSIRRAEAIEVSLGADYLEAYGSTAKRPEDAELIKRFRLLSYEEQKAVALPSFHFASYVL